MPGATTLYYRLRIRNAANTADALVLTSVRGGTNPYLQGPPTGDGASFDPLTGQSMLGSYTGTIVDSTIGGLQRILTAQLEDANGRQQLGYRWAYVEMGTDGTTFPTVLIAGLVALLRLIDGITWEYTVQDPMRAQAVSKLFAPSSSMKMCKTSPADPDPAWFSSWPNRGCIAGGPIMSGGSGVSAILYIADLGGWQMRVEATSDPNKFILRPYVVYGPPGWQANTRSNLKDFNDTINQAAAQFQIAAYGATNDAWTTVGDGLTHGFAWANLVVLIDQHDGNGFQPWRPIPFSYNYAPDENGRLIQDAVLVAKVQGNWGMLVSGDTVRTLTAGSLVKVRVLTVLPTETCPLYVQGHPLDVLAQFWTAAKIPYDSGTAFTNLKSAIGTDAVITLRITDAQQLDELVNTVTAFFGIGLRSNTSGQVQVFDARLGTSNALPVVTIGSADVVDGSTKLVFELDPAQAVSAITFTQQRFTDQRNVPAGARGSLVDGVTVTDDSITLANADTSALPYGELTIATQGMITSASGVNPNWQNFVTTAAQRIFDRFGHGGIALETTFLRGGAGDAVNLGDEVLVNLPQLPNHNYRLGDNNAVAARRMQIVRRTVTPIGYEVRLLDSGANAQPLGTVPTLSIAASSDMPRSVALFTITNAATLNGLGYGLRLQWAVTTGAAPSAGQWTDVQAWAAGAIPVSACRLPPVQSGSTVYVRARSEGVANALASNYGASANVSLSGLAAPASVTATPGGSDGSLCTLAWTPGSGATAAGDLTDIWLRTNGQSFVQATRIAILNPGSTTYLIEALTPGAAYVASVQHRDPHTGNVSSAIDVSFTAGATTRTLNAPVGASGFCGSTDPVTGVPQRDGTYGIAVVATEVPGFLEVQVATETSAGSGTYGAFATVAVQPAIASVQGDWTKAAFAAPNDGLRRQLRARHVADGCTPSAYTSAVTVLPWTPLYLPAFESNNVSDVLNAAPATNGTTANVPVQFDNQTAVGAACARYSLDGGSTWTTTGTVASDFTTTFSGIALTASPQSMLIQGKNAIDGNWGNATTVQLDALGGGVASVQVLRNTPDATHDRFTLSATRGALTVSIDGAAYTTLSASPWDVSNASNHTYDWLLTAPDGSKTPWHFDVGPGLNVPTVTLAIGNCVATNAGVTGPPYNQLDIAWSVSGMPAGTTYDVSYNNGGANMDTATGISGTSKTFTGVTFGGTPGSGSVTVIAQGPNGTLKTAVKNKPYLT